MRGRKEEEEGGGCCYNLLYHRNESNNNQQLSPWNSIIIMCRYQIFGGPTPRSGPLILPSLESGARQNPRGVPRVECFDGIPARLRPVCYHEKTRRKMKNKRTKEQTNEAENCSHRRKSCLPRVCPLRACVRACLRAFGVCCKFYSYFFYYRQFA